MPGKNKRFLRLNASLKQMYYIFVISIAAITFLSLVIFSWNIYSHYSRSFEKDLAVEARRIDRELTHVFNDTAQILIYLGQQIAKNGKAEDLEYIKNIFLNAYTINILAVKMGTGISPFDWVTSQGLQVVNGKEGIVDSPYDLSHREYVTKGKQNPWKPTLCKPTFGVPSKFWVIPIGVAVNDAASLRNLGIVTAGIVIDKVVAHLEQHTKIPEMSFLVLDPDMTVIAHSSNYKGALPLKTLENSKKSDSSLFDRSDWRALASSVTSMKYTYAWKMEHYPYIIITAFDPSVMNKIFSSHIYPRLFEGFFIGLFCISLLYFFRKKIIDPLTGLSQIAIVIAKGNSDTRIPRQTSLEMHYLAKALMQVKRYIRRSENAKSKVQYAYDLLQASEKERRNFLGQVRKLLKNPISIIRGYTDLLIKFLRRELDQDISPDKQLELMYNIQKAIYELENLSLNGTQYSYCNIIELLESSLLIVAKASFNRNIRILTHSEFIPFLLTDELQLKQIMVGLLSLSIHSCPRGSVIHIHFYQVDHGKNSKLRICIQDNGLALDQDYFIKYSNTIKTPMDYSFDGTNLSFEVLESMVHTLKGTLVIQPHKDGGKLIMLDLPFQPLHHNLDHSRPYHDLEKNSKLH